MGNLSNLQKQNRPWILRVLYHPMFVISVALHSLLLIMPTLPEREAVPEAEKEEIEEEEPEVVDVLNLNDLLPEEPLPPQEDVVAETPPPQQQAAPVPEGPPPVPSKEQQTAPPDPNPPNAPPPANTPPPENTPPPPPNLDPTNLPASNFGSCDPSNKQWPPFPTSFAQYSRRSGWDPASLPNLSLFFTADSVTSETFETVPAIQTCSLLDDLEKEEFTATYPDITFNEDLYGGETFYELVDQSGQAFRYVSLFQLSGATLLITWAVDPR